MTTLRNLLVSVSMLLPACAGDAGEPAGTHLQNLAEECQGGVCCPDPDDPDVEYIGGSDQDPSVCDTIGVWQCDDGWQIFTGDCGCGCVHVDDADPDHPPTCDGGGA
jgi:hypothetical protein